MKVLAVGLALAAWYAVPAMSENTNVVLAARSSHVNENGKDRAKRPIMSLQDIAKAPVPQSSFTIPRQVREGKDPFFPNSVRVYNSGRISKPSASPVFDADLVLRGFSGSPEQPSAIINTTTFMSGEVNEVLLKNGRLKLHCIKIDMNAGTVLIQVGNERRELRLGTN